MLCGAKKSIKHNQCVNGTVDFSCGCTNRPVTPALCFGGELSARTMSKTNYPAQIPVIKGALDGYLKSAEFLYRDLKDRFVSRENENSLEGVVSNPGELSPLVTNIAFSIELALKILRIQDDPDHGPRGHDLLNLWRPVSNDIKEMAEEKYSELLSAWDENDPLKYVAFSKNQVPEPESGKTLNQALKNLKNSFVDWRYMYEAHEAPKSLVFNFVEANCAIKALTYASAEFKGGVTVQSGWTSKT